MNRRKKRQWTFADIAEQLRDFEERNRHSECVVTYRSIRFRNGMTITFVGDTNKVAKIEADGVELKAAPGHEPEYVSSGTVFFGDIEWVDEIEDLTEEQCRELAERVKRRKAKDQNNP